MTVPPRPKRPRRQAGFAAQRRPGSSTVVGPRRNVRGSAPLRPRLVERERSHHPRCVALGYDTGDGPGVLHLHRECSTAFLEQLTSEHLVYRRPKKKPKGRWVWAPKTEGRANHHFDVLVGVYALADIKGFRLLPARDVVEARLSQAQARAAGGGAKPGGGGGGVRTPDGRAFFATQRR